MTIQDLGQKVKDKYQQYVQYPVEELGRKVIEKYPEYKSKLDQSFQVMNDIGERYGQQEKMGYLLTGGSGNVAGKVKDFLQARNLPGQTMAQAFSDMRTNNPQYQTNVKMSMGAPISETDKQGTRDSALQFAAGTTEPLKMPGFKGLNSAINKASNIEDVLGSKPYVSGIPQRWMYKDSNGVPQDVPDDIVKLIRKTGYKPFKLQKVTKTSNNLYHTTPSTNLDSIAREGLVTGKPARFEGVSSPTKISFSANEAGAAYYGGADDVMIRTKSGYDPGDLDIDLLAGGEGTYRTGKNIPPEMLEVKIKGKWQPLTQASTSQGKASNGLKFDLESTGGEKRLIVDLFPDESIRGKGITKAETLKAFDNAYKQGNKIVEPSNGIWTNDGFGFIKHLEEQGYVKQIPNRGGIERFEIIPRTQATAPKKQSKPEVKKPAGNAFQDTLPSKSKPSSVKNVVNQGGNPLFHDTDSKGVIGILDSGQIKTSQPPFGSIAGQGTRVSTTRNFDNYSRYSKSPYRFVIDETKTGQRSIPDNREEFESIFTKPVKTNSLESLAIDITNPALITDMNNGNLAKVIQKAKEKGIRIEVFEGKVLPDVASNKEIQELTKNKFNKEYGQQLTDLYTQATASKKQSK